MTSASVTIEVSGGTDITIGDDGTSAYTLTVGGLGKPIITPRYTYAPESPDVDGKVLLQAARDLSALPLEVLVTGTSASDLDDKIAALDAALWQFSYTVTVTVAGVATVYRAQPTVSQVASGATLHSFADQNMAVLSVTIPVQPNPVEGV